MRPSPIFRRLVLLGVPLLRFLPPANFMRGDRARPCGSVVLGASFLAALCVGLVPRRRPDRSPFAGAGEEVAV